MAVNILLLTLVVAHSNIARCDPSCDQKLPCGDYEENRSHYVYCDFACMRDVKNIGHEKLRGPGSDGGYEVVTWVTSDVTTLQTSTYEMPGQHRERYNRYMTKIKKYWFTYCGVCQWPSTWEGEKEVKDCGCPTLRNDNESIAMADGTRYEIRDFRNTYVELHDDLWYTFVEIAGARWDIVYAKSIAQFSNYNTLMTKVKAYWLRNCGVDKFAANNCYWSENWIGSRDDNNCQSPNFIYNG